MKSAEREEIILEQYKLYVEMTDRVSSRRAGTNQFFITVLGAGLAISTVTLDQTRASNLQVAILVIVILFGLMICTIWDRILESYRQLNSSKFEVIHDMEQCLPITPYVDEWVKLGEGKNLREYYQLTKVEQLVPRLLGIPYALLFVLAIYSAFGVLS